MPTACARPPAARSKAERGAGRLALVLDRRRRRGEGSAAGVAPGGRPRDRRLWKAGGGKIASDHQRRTRGLGLSLMRCSRQA